MMNMSSVNRYDGQNVFSNQTSGRMSLPWVAVTACACGAIVGLLASFDSRAAAFSAASRTATLAPPLTANNAAANSPSSRLQSLRHHAVPAERENPSVYQQAAAVSTGSSVRPATLLWPLAALFAVLGFATTRRLRRAGDPPSLQWTTLPVVASIEDTLEVKVDVGDDIVPPQSALREMQPRLCCPTCLQPLTGSVCHSCSVEYSDTDNGSFLNLIPASGRPIKSDRNANPTPTSAPLITLPFVKDSQPVIERMEEALLDKLGLPRLRRVAKGTSFGEKRGWGKEMFENPLVAGVYERGWRQSFSLAGFPGVDAEFQRAMDWLLPVAKGKAVLDLSCGSGLFTRRFVASGEFAKVFALDYSENMLRQTRQGFDIDAELSRQAVAADLELVRGDVARLPFPSNSLAAIHAGASLHCWPSPTLAMSEIARVLAPGGRAVISTFLVPGQDVPFLNEELRATFVAPVVGRGIRYWEESELRDLCACVGLVNFEAERERICIIFKVEKPAA